MKKSLFVFITLFFSSINFYSISQERIIYLDGIINDSISSDISCRLLELDAESDLPIKLIINSPGGNVYAMLGIYDAMVFVNSPIYTECHGIAASGAALILAAGKNGHRGAIKNSRIMIHDAYLINKKIAEDALAERELRMINDELYRILSESTGRSLESIIQDCSYDKWFTPEDALEYGLIDYIMDESEITIKIP